MRENTSKPIKSLSDSAKEYLKEEQKQRRQEIENLITRIESDQRNGLIFTGAIWAWLATNVDKLGNQFAHIIAFVPALIMLFFLWRWHRIERTILIIAEYTVGLEKLFEVPTGYGWEGWSFDRRNKGTKIDPLTTASFAFWVLLIIANGGLAVLLVCFRRLPT